MNRDNPRAVGSRFEARDGSGGTLGSLVTTAAAIGHQAKPAADDVALRRGIIAESRGVADPSLAAGAPRRAIRGRRFKVYAST